LKRGSKEKAETLKAEIGTPGKISALKNVIATVDDSQTISAVKELSKGTRAAVLFQRFGPYHHARLNAAGRLMPVWGVEACAMETTYAWSKVEGASAFTRVTLTDRDSGDRSWKLELQKKMRRALDEINPQIVAVNGWATTEAVSALEWCMTNRVPAVVMSESTAWDEPRVFWKEWIKGRLVKLFAAGLAGGTPHADYLAQLGLPRDRIFKGYDIVDNDYFAAGAARARSKEQETRSQIGLPEKYFLASARFVEKKNLSRLLQAYARYRLMAEKPGTGNREPEIWELVLLGDGPLRETLDSQLSTLNLREHVLLPGFKQYEELPAYFGLAGAFVHASTTEQWGLVVNEAMASGLPVLVSNRCGCAADLVQEGVNGFTFDPCDVEQLADLMLKISAFNFQLSTFGLESLRIISAWGPEQFANGLRDAVSTAMGHPHPRAGFLDRLLLRLLLCR
jgi:1,2-diacylglycerol 3-alpha-glucosyltransferase